MTEIIQTDSKTKMEETNKGIPYRYLLTGI